MTEITKGNFCITNSEGNELTSTFFITNKLTIEVTDAYNLRQLLKGLLEAELLRRSFNRGVRSGILHLVSRKRSKVFKKPLQRGAKSVFAHQLHSGILHHLSRKGSKVLKKTFQQEAKSVFAHHPQHRVHRQPSSGTFNKNDHKIAETPIATQQTAAISHSTLWAQMTYLHKQHVSNKARAIKTQGNNISIGETYDHDLPSRGQGHTNIS